MAVWNKVGSNGAAWYSLCQRKKGGSDVVGTVRVGTVKKSVQTGTEQEIGAERERVGSDGVGDKGVGSAPPGKLADLSREVSREEVCASAQMGLLARFTPLK
jgi:hypothetical protein